MAGTAHCKPVVVGEREQVVRVGARSGKDSKRKNKIFNFIIFNFVFYSMLFVFLISNTESESEAGSD